MIVGPGSGGASAQGGRRGRQHRADRPCCRVCGAGRDRGARFQARQGLPRFISRC